MRVCTIAGCPTIYAGNNSRCPAHQQSARQAREGNDVYSSRGHRLFRRAVLKRDPVCVNCRIQQATVADHHPLTRRELVEQGLDPNDPDNGRGLCATCHNKHTAATTPGGWAATQG